jgi:hypothetical protein
MAFFSDAIKASRLSRYLIFWNSKPNQIATLQSQYSASPRRRRDLVTEFGQDGPDLVLIDWTISYPGICDAILRMLEVAKRRAVHEGSWHNSS